MSYDVSFSRKVCADTSFNYTYNVSQMFYMALGADGLRSLSGMECSDAVLLLERGVNHMQNNPEQYKNHNPPNGWGDYEGALRFLQGILDFCRANPDFTISVD